MKRHRLVSGAGESFGPLGGEDVAVYRNLLEKLISQDKLSSDGVAYNPYGGLETEGELLALVHAGELISEAQTGDHVEVLLPETDFYVAAGGQVSDTGRIISKIAGEWEIRVTDMRKPSAGITVHVGEVVRGKPRVGDPAIAQVDAPRRSDIIRNHTATHLLHAELRAVLGKHARQAGSLVAPDRLRFDFTHPSAVTPEQLEQIENGVNRAILGNYPLSIAYKPLQQAIDEGATALFGEKYADTVRNITIGEPQVFSNELCGGTHVEETGDIGLFLITSEGSAAAGIRRIEAVTGRFSCELAQGQIKALKQSARILTATPEEVPYKIEAMVAENAEIRKKVNELRRTQAMVALLERLERVPTVQGVPVLTAILSEADTDTMRFLTDKFRERNPSGVAVLASVSSDGKPFIIAAITEDLVERGLHAGQLVKFVAQPLGGGGGGRPTLAQAGGKDASKLEESLAGVPMWVENNLS
jgi:alanyl-tRNA synthetase